MKFYSAVLSIASIIVALVAAIMMALQGQYFRCFLLVVYAVTACDVFYIRKHLEDRELDPLNRLR